MDNVIDKILAAHGGAPYWRSLSALEVELSATGLLFTSKFRPVLDHVRLRAETGSPRLTFFDFPQSGQTSEFNGDREVAVRGADGSVLARRAQPRAAFGGRRMLYWDHLDFVYFAGYATWNYLMAPFLFVRDGFTIEEVETPAGSPYFKTLHVTFPDDVPTHSRRQTFYFDDELLLRRLDYTAEVIGGWARAAHLCDEYKTLDGLKIPVRRRVYPILLRRRSSWPTLVAIDIHRVRAVHK